QFEPAAVLRIAEQRMAHVRHVHADLVRAARFEAAFDQRLRTKTLAHAIVRDRLAAIRAHGLLQAIAWMASDRRIDAAAGNHLSVNDRDTLPVPRALRKVP